MAKVIRLRKAGPDDPIFKLGPQFFKPIARPSNWRELDERRKSNSQTTSPDTIWESDRLEKPE